MVRTSEEQGPDDRIEHDEKRVHHKAKRPDRRVFGE